MMFEDGNSDTISPATCNLQLASLPCDHWHHYYHYQASAQYLWLAAALRALGREAEAKEAYGKAVFQDHQNQEAIAGARGKEQEGRAPAYDKHPLTDIAFCASVGQLPTEATRLHDEGVSAWQNGEQQRAIAFLDEAIAAEPTHSNSYFARGRYWFAKKEYEKAQVDFAEAVRLSHLHHESYHRFASGEHLARGKAFLAAGEMDLAIADFTKALDLWRGNKEAMTAREEVKKMIQMTR